MTTIRDWRSPGCILSPVADGGSTEIMKEISGRGLGLQGLTMSIALDHSPQDPALLSGTVDLHIHTTPDIFPRNVTAISAAEEAKRLGMAAIVVKSHSTDTAARGPDRQGDHRLPGIRRGGTELSCRRPERVRRPGDGATGHLHPGESLLVAIQAARRGIRRVIVTHPHVPFVGMSPAVAAQLADTGAFIEVTDHEPVKDGWK
jgi:hypothetical protein